MKCPKNGRLLCEYNSEIGDGANVFIEYAQSRVAGNAGVRAPSGDGVKCGVLAWSAADDPETHQEMESRLGSRNGEPVSEAYSLAMNAKSLVGSVIANLSGSYYPLHMLIVEASSQRVMFKKAFSVPMCVRLARMLHHSQQLLRRTLGAVPGSRVEDLSDTLGEELLSLEKENSSDSEKQSASGQTLNNAQAVDENDLIHAKMMEFEPLLEASGERNLWSINLTHGDYPCHYLH